ncbi:MAG TPA: hypothetical protein DCO83_13350 [Mucilaginibacter sp.]|nr:hypothetical protein [Mucilaginibacter sp.]
MRYMLREGNDAFVPLSAEAHYLENVIELQRISAKGNAYINFDRGNMVTEQKVAALLFVSFVENAFKHGVLNDPEAPVDICLSAAAGKIEFAVKNKKNNNQKDKTGGIGLYNVRRRLELIYPGKHKLDIIDVDEFYSIHLVLQTSLQTCGA